MGPQLRPAITALAIASFLALLEMIRTNLSRALEGHTITTYAVHRLAMTWILLVLVSPWCAFMARRYPFRGRRGLTLVAHLGGAAAFVALHLTLMIALHALATGEHPRSGREVLQLYGFYAAMEASVYCAIVLVLLLLDARQQAAERAVAAARLERGLAAARLESLQAQIRPHFLFNTLNVLAVLARRGDGDVVDRAIGDLGELLRASFDTPRRNEIPLAEELSLVERYVSLQGLRFPDRLDVRWEVEPGARAALVPALVVQPLVENAIEHGLATARGGRVRIAARREGDALTIEVADDGPGFTGAAAGADGVGLANTRERLALLYGAAASLVCSNAAGGGGTVRLCVPWRTAGPA